MSAKQVLPYHTYQIQSDKFLMVVGSNLYSYTPEAKVASSLKYKFYEYQTLANKHLLTYHYYLLVLIPMKHYDIFLIIFL